MNKTEGIIALLSLAVLPWLSLSSNAQNMRKQFKNEVSIGVKRTNALPDEILTEKDLEHLPQLVQKYIRYTGAVGKPKVKNMRVEFNGKIRGNPEDGWMKFKSVQYNFFDEPTRAFYINARKMGIPASGLHLYKNKAATMVMKIAGLFKVVDAKGPEMDQSETVTVFNDMCLMAPASLISKNIQWEEVDTVTVKAKFTNGNITIEATLIFNEKGELINFNSPDRYECNDGIHYYNYPWSTPVANYKKLNGYNIFTFGKTIYHRPDIDFCYGEFNLSGIAYNVNE